MGVKPTSLISTGLTASPEGAALGLAVGEEDGAAGADVVGTLGAEEVGALGGGDGGADAHDMAIELRMIRSITGITRTRFFIFSSLYYYFLGSGYNLSACIH
jgi:hypothetical protein